MLSGEPASPEVWAKDIPSWEQASQAALGQWTCHPEEPVV